MNFFEHQARARRYSRRLVVLFLLAVISVVAAIDLLVLLVLGAALPAGSTAGFLSQAHLQSNSDLLLASSLVTAGVIAVASLYRLSSLRAGGGQVARELGATLVESDPGEPLRRRLRNVVEEIALASGVPVPEVYVLEQEPGINAFAAGYSPADAAVAVTQGALEKLNRDELQGVIAHEFSHVLNGDMRLNIRLMGALFGILLLAVIGRKVLFHTRHLGRGRNKEGVAVLLIAFGLMMIGYIGLFFGRWIKAAVSRQREYLADASAVQFTRDPQGIGGALKKIALYANGSHMQADTEEVGHMLFGRGRKMALFSTHPPLLQRIQRIEPGFKESQLELLREDLVNQQRREARLAERKQAAEQQRSMEAEQHGSVGGGMFNPADWLQQIGQPNWQNMLTAAVLAAGIPQSVRRAAESPEWAPEVLCYTLLDHNAELREQQLLLVAQHLGAESEARLRALISAGGLADDHQRLPLLELAFPALKRRPGENLLGLLSLVKKLVQTDGRTDMFEYLLSRLVSKLLWESKNPSQVRTAGRKKLHRNGLQARRLLALMANHGHRDTAISRQAFAAGLHVLGVTDSGEMPDVEDWIHILDHDLPVLDQLAPLEKQKLVAALMATVQFDQQATSRELEILRVVCELIHVPLPIIAQQPG